MHGGDVKLSTTRAKHGGKREGAGRKRQVRNHSEKTIKRWEAAARKLAREKGESIEYHLLSMLWDDDTQDSVKASIMKTYNEALIIKKTEQKSEATVTTNQGPVIGLPTMKKDPALEVVDGGKK